MSRHVTLGLILSLLSLTALADKEPIYKDTVRDASDRFSNPTRIKLQRERSLSLGRFGGVWGSVDGSDPLDVFFFGKTTGHARLRVTLVTAESLPIVTLKISANDGQEVRSEMLISSAGEAVESWFRMKGKIYMQVSSSAKEKSYYALYVWYPGDRFDGLSRQEFETLRSGKAPARAAFIRQMNPESRGQ